jgi:ubiquinone biosynthesis protein UbiJ
MVLEGEAVTRPFILTRLAESALNRLLRLDPETLRRLGELDGKRLRLRLADPAGRSRELDLLPSEGGLRLDPASGDHEPDVMIAGTPAVFARLLFGEARPDSRAELTIRGDMELGNRFRAILERLDLDWEEQVSHVTGDVIAHALGNAARDLRAWGRETARALGQDAADYLHEESRLLAPRERIEAFLADVDRLRAEAERLEQRLARLEAR